MNPFNKLPSEKKIETIRQFLWDLDNIRDQNKDKSFFELSQEVKRSLSHKDILESYMFDLMKELSKRYERGINE